jgi:hypothetical protein
VTRFARGHHAQQTAEVVLLAAEVPSPSAEVAEPDLGDDVDVSWSLGHTAD